MRKWWKKWKEDVIQFLFWTVACVLIGGLIAALLYFKTQEVSKEDESDKDDGVTYLENSDSVELIGIDIVTK